MRFSTCLWILISILPCAVLAEDKYFVEFDKDLDGVEVIACFDGQAPRRLYRHTDSAQYTKWIRVAGQSLKVTADRSSIPLPDLGPNNCLEWRVELRSATRKMDRRTGFSIGGDLLVETRIWFWKGNRERDVLVKVEVPEGMSFSTPWPEARDISPGQWFRPDKTPSSWTSRIAVGRFPIDFIKVPGASVRLAAVGKLQPTQRDRIRAWIKNSALAVSTVYGRFPQADTQVLVVPIGKRDEPVPWAHVTRGGGVTVELFIDETRPLEEFTDDWTAMHEFSHLLLPHVSTRDRWLSEGLASYYQNVLRARHGILTGQQAWQLLHDGFKRGQRNTNGGTLAEAARSGRGSTMRVYWSGAALMLMADTELRAQTDGQLSLDSALARLQDCCMSNDRSWRARDLMAQLDRLTGREVFSSLYREHVYNRQFPDFSDTWADLGLETRYNRVTLLPGAPLSTVRDAIMDD
jgi:predicted metalloprotease with PDZ domain